MIEALHIRADGHYELFVYDPRAHDPLETLQSRVGGYIEAAPVLDRRLTMYCNEEGKLQNLPLNQVASLMLDPRAKDVIAGDVVITGEPDSEGYDTTLPHIEMIHKILKEDLWLRLIRRSSKRRQSQSWNTCLPSKPQRACRARRADRRGDRRAEGQDQAGDDGGHDQRTSTTG